VQRAEEKVARLVAREETAGPVAAMRRRSESDEEKARARVTKRR